MYCFSGKCCECTGTGVCTTTGGTKYGAKTGICNGCECLSASCDDIVDSWRSQCASWGGTFKSSSSSVTEDRCHAVFSDCGGKYYYCLAALSGC